MNYPRCRCVTEQKYSKKQQDTLKSQSFCLWNMSEIDWDTLTAMIFTRGVVNQADRLRMEAGNTWKGKFT